MGHYRVTVNDPGLMQGVPVEVPGVGVIENGSTMEVELIHEPFWVPVADGQVAFRNVPAVVEIEAVEGGESE